MAQRLPSIVAVESRHCSLERAATRRRCCRSIIANRYTSVNGSARPSIPLAGYVRQGLILVVVQLEEKITTRFIADCFQHPDFIHLGKRRKVRCLFPDFVLHLIRYEIPVLPLKHENTLVSLLFCQLWQFGCKGLSYHVGKIVTDLLPPNVKTAMTGQWFYFGRECDVEIGFSGYASNEALMIAAALRQRDASARKASGAPLTGQSSES
jgi:hypothetical protein